ncbi:MAG TPA: ABC transporter permease [Acidimicrobiales bacterium]|nr:ABC transporter permease [Acidimicrobiales bacterium]
MRWRRELRSGWRSILLLVVLVGLGGGMALTALAGARRADTAMPRFVHYSRPGTGAVFFGDSPFTPPPVAGAAAGSLSAPPYTRGVLSLPQVESWYRVLYLFTSTEGDRAGVVNTFGVVDPAATRSVDRPLVVAGRLPDPSDPLEAVVDELAAPKLHLHVGSPLHVRSYSADQLRGGSLAGGVGNGPTEPTGPSYTLRVTGIVRFATDVNAIVPVAAKQDVVYEGQQNVYMSSAFVPRLAHDLGVPVQQMSGMNVFSVRLRHGPADWQPFVAAAKKLTAGSSVPVQFEAGDTLGIQTAARSAARGIRVETTALALFGGLAALVTVLLVGQAVSRQLRADAADRAVLRSLGATRWQLAGAAMLRPALVAAAGSLVALAVAAAASPLMPVGLARKAEIHPGFSFNAAVLCGSAGLLSVVLVLRAAVPAWLLSRPTPANFASASGAPVGVPGVLGRLWTAGTAPLPALIGVRFAFGSRSGNRTVPVVTALVGAVAAVAGLAAAITFGGSLDHLVSNPPQQGWTWDLMVGNPNDSSDAVAQGSPLLAADRMVAAYSAVGELGSVDVDGVTIPQLLAFDQIKGSVHPPVLEGRAPSAPDEIVLATHTMQALHGHIGETVTGSGPDGKPYRFRIVGRMVAPSVGDVLTNGLGDGAWIDASFVHQQWRSASNPAGTPPDGADVLNFFVVKLAPGTHLPAAVARLQKDFGPTVLQHLPAEDAVNLQSVSGLPFALAALIALLGAATVGHALVSSVRQRRRDLAVLKTLGFVRRQVAATVAWQSTSFALVALAVGIPLGLAGGRWAWSVVASGIYSVSPPVIPLLAVVVVIPATVLVCNAVAAWPARAAGRLPAALAMRSE